MTRIDKKLASTTTALMASSLVAAFAQPARADDGTASLDKELVRRVVRGHIDEVRWCYEQGLQYDPDLQGRVAVRMVIGSEGFVTTAEIASSDLPDTAVSDCIVDAVTTWTFPPPEGAGNLVVTYPFVLKPG